MTLIILFKKDDKIHCFSDSRVSRRSDGGIRKTTDKFSKIMLLPVHATRGISGESEATVFRGEIGFAFCGDVLFATALYTMASNMFLNLHRIDAISPPSINKMADALSNLANALLDDYIFHAHERDYQVTIFGWCPARNELDSYLIEFDHSKSPVKYAAKRSPIFEGAPMVLGSGSKHFYEKANAAASRGGVVLAPSILLRIIHEAVEPTVGGALQACTADRDGVRILPVAQPVNDYMNLDYFVSGVSARDLPSIDGYTIGRTMVGYDNEVVLENQWLASIGFSKKREDNPDSANRQAELMRHIQLSQQMKKPMAGIHSYLTVHPPVAPIFNKFFFFARCHKCKKPVKIMEDSTNGGNPQPFFGAGGFEGTCPICFGKVRVAANGLRSKIDKMNPT